MAMFSWLKTYLSAENDKQEIPKNFSGETTITIYESKSTNRVFKIDAELGSQHTKSVDTIFSSVDDKEPCCSHSALTNDEGDVIPPYKLKHTVEKSVEEQPLKTAEKDVTQTNFSLEVIESNEDDRLEKPDNSESVDMIFPFRKVSSRHSLMDLNKLMLHSVQPQPSVSYKELANLKLTQDNALVLSQHLHKMRKGILHLREMADKFKCLEKYESDVNYLIENVADAIKTGEQQTSEENKQST